MKKSQPVCKNCGHVIGKPPNGLYVYREDAFRNIRIYSSGRDWLHLVEYEEDRKRLGYVSIPEYLDELKEVERELGTKETNGDIEIKEANQLRERLELLRLKANFLVDSIKGPERDSRMFTVRCWGNNGRCRCRNPTQEEKEALK